MTLPKTIWPATSDIDPAAAQRLLAAGFQFVTEPAAASCAWLGLEWQPNPCPVLACPATGVQHLPQDRTIVHLSGRELPHVWATAEWTLQLMLWCLRPGTERGAELRGSTIGLIGCGRIGGQLKRMLTGLGATVRWCDRSCINYIQQLAAVLRESDLISCHATYQPGSLPVLCAEQLLTATSRRCRYIVNTARPQLVDWNAVLDHLKAGTLLRAASDFPLTVHHANLREEQHHGGQTHTSRRLTDQALAKKLIGHWPPC